MMHTAKGCEQITTQDVLPDTLVIDASHNVGTLYLSRLLSV